MNRRTEIDEGKDPAQLERDIDRTRSSLERTVDELETRLSPGELLDQALGVARDYGGDFATNLGRSVRNNPVPVVLTGVGLAWMMASSNEPRAPSRTYAHSTDLSDSVGDAKQRLQSGVRSARSAASAAGDRAAHLKDSLGDAATNAGERVRMESDRIRRGFDHLMEEQPLLVGALGIALGAALGAALPRTEHEDRLMGETSDSAARSVKEKASDVIDEAKKTAADVVASSREESRRERSSTGEAGDAQREDPNRL
jgi:hypothetical protein